MAGHIYMHDTTAPEASHRFNVKEVMQRVRKGTDFDTGASAVDYVLRVRTSAKVIDLVHESSTEAPKRRTRRVRSLTVVVNDSKQLSPPACVAYNTFSPLRTGDQSLLAVQRRKTILPRVGDTHIIIHFMGHRLRQG